MGFFKSLISEAVDNLKDSVVNSVQEATNVNLSSIAKSSNASPSKNEFDHDKQVYGVRSLKVAYNGSKYAVFFKDDDEKHLTPYEYDDVMAMSQYHVRTSKMQPDGSVLYGVITGGWHFHDTGCEYQCVDFFDEDVLFLIDEDGDKYTIDSGGDICSLEKYMQKFKESLTDEEEEDEEENDDDDGSNDYESSNDDDDEESDSSSALMTGLKVGGKIVGGGLKLMGKIFD